MGRKRGPYGTNEGDIWASEGSAVQKMMDEREPGKKLIVEMMVEDGELQECLYVVDTHAGLWQKEQYEKALAGTELRREAQAQNN